MPTKNPLPITITPLNPPDIPACSLITSHAFAVDPHTLVKNLGRQPYDMHTISSSGFRSTLHKKNYIYIKAVDQATGDIVGHAGWAVRGWEEAKVKEWMRRVEGWGSGDEELRVNVDEWVEDEHVESRRGEKEKEDVVDAEKREEGYKKIDQLHALEDADMQYWQSTLIPLGPCVFIVGLIVSPSHQSRGVGSTLIRHGNAVADKLELVTWVHSSDQAWRAYQKGGFEVSRELEVDLDEYAPRGPREGESVMEEEGTGKWGRYVIRYMKRMPRSTA